MSASVNTHRPASEFPWERLGEVMARDWWLLALRGVLGVMFGVIALGMPVATILALVLLFSAYMLVDGCFALATALRAMWRHDSWGMPLIIAVLNFITGAIAFLWPGITVLTFVLLLAAWSIVSGSLMLAGAYSIEGRYGRGWLVLSGLVSLLYGIVMIFAPVIGAIVLTWWLGAYSLVFGLSLIVLAFRLRSQRTPQRSFGATESTT